MATTNQTDTDTESAPTPADTSPSPGDADQALAQNPGSPGEQTASPPDAPAKDERQALLDVVQAVVKDDSKTPSQGEPPADKPGQEAPSTDPASPTPPATPDAETEPDPTADELKALAPRTRRRVETLLKQRGEARAELETLKPAAAKWQQMDTYLTRNDLAAEDVNLLLGVGAALRRGDFKAFRDGVMPYLELCNQHLGISLPADLQSKVDSGEMTTEAATELSVARLTNARLEGQNTAHTQAAQAAAQEREAAQISAAVSGAVTVWENDQRARDPDWNKKVPTIVRMSQALMSEFGQPRTPEDALVLAKRAYEETNAIFARAMPPRPASRPAPVGVHQVNNVRPEPRNMMEAVTAALDRMRA